MNVILCNCPPAESSALAKTLVQERLAACINVIAGVTSHYIWDETLQEDTEDTLLIKAPAANLPRLSDRIRELHSYDTVEIVVLGVDVDASDTRYVRWVRGCTLPAVEEAD